ncbi:MAG: diaminopimelate epimerase [Elusimicrobiota bacterium]
MPLRFVKMSGAGNDFILLRGKVTGLPALAKRLCPRRSSIGADGLLVMYEISTRVRRLPKGHGAVPHPRHGFRYYNADGSRAFCANGCRCAAWYAYLNRWAGRRFVLGTDAGPVECRIAGEERVRILMPAARIVRRVRANGLDATCVHTGVPHAVVRVRRSSALARLDVRGLGRALRRHPVFGRGGTNVDFLALSRGRAFLRTYERGVEDETLACGTGAVAAALLCAKRGPVKLSAPGGSFTVDFRPLGDGRFTDVWLEGPARVVYEGVFRT